MRARDLAAVLLALCTSAAAQLVATDPDWKETEVPPPPVLKTDTLVPVEMGASELRWGIDPASISIGADGIVRYVVVAASSSGVVNAFYEGLRCASAEVKVYARHSGGSGWSPVRNTDWRPLSGTSWRHSRQIAYAGACEGRSPNRSAERILRELRSGRSWHEPR